MKRSRKKMREGEANIKERSKQRRHVKEIQKDKK